MIHQPDDIAPVMKKAFETRGPVIVGVHVDHRDNHKLLEMLHGTAFTDSRRVPHSGNRALSALHNRIERPTNWNKNSCRVATRVSFTALRADGDQ
jgi:hypothetical protein